MIYKCIHLDEIRVCPEFYFYIKALGHENAMQSHKLRTTTKIEAWGSKTRLAGEKFWVIIITKDTEKFEYISGESAGNLRKLKQYLAYD